MAPRAREQGQQKTQADEPRLEGDDFVRMGGVRTPYDAGSMIFRQGDPADSIYYIESGQVLITVTSAQGKEGALGTLLPGEFFGEGCLAGQVAHVTSAQALTDAGLVRVRRETMVRALHERPEISRRFMAFLLAHTLKVEADLIDQLFNSSEKRLARALLLLANFGNGEPHGIVPKISQEMLAAQVGTTRSRINLFLNKFRKLGFIEYSGTLEGLKVHPALLKVILSD
jgi:CRP/FNR family transcriptional regulator, cyclic AMP receptor protein